MLGTVEHVQARPQLRWSRRMVVAAGALAAVGAAAAPVQALTPGPLLAPASVAVDFGSEQGALLRTERWNNFANPRAFPEQRPADVAHLNEQGLHGDVYRAWMDDDAKDGTGYADLCDVAAGTCDFSSVAGYFRDASTVSDSVLMVVMPATLMKAKAAPAETKPIVKLVIKTLKEQFPAIEYIEAFNEPDHKFGSGKSPILTPEELYPYYVPMYEAVNEVNEELQPATPLKIGGPAYSGFTTRWVDAFLKGYAQDTNPGKRLDFISWHGYGHFDPEAVPGGFHMYKEDPSEVATHRAQLEQMLTRHGLPTDIPAWITEVGIYPGPSFDDPTGRTDYVRSAAGAAALHYWYASQPNTYPFHWVVRHTTDERKDQFVTRQLPTTPHLPGITPNTGQVSTAPGVPTNIFTPYGNTMLMQSKMKTTKVTATSDSLEAGKGVYALAAKDGSGASMMVWNYQHIQNNAFRATIDMDNVPGNLRNKPVRQRTYRVDQTTSNFFSDPRSYATPGPEAGALELVDEAVVTPGKTFAATVDLEANAIYLILLEPA